MKQTGVAIVLKSGACENISRLALAASLIWIPLAMGASAHAQITEQTPEQGANVSAPVVPQQVRYTGDLATRSGDTVEAVFNIYAAPQGGEPLWTETQQVAIGVDGSYTVLLGSASPVGLPQTIFQGGAARWLGISVERAPEQARVPLSSVPYAMKSADAQALAGHPAGDFVTQEQLSAFAQSEAQRAVAPEFQPLTSGTITGSGTTGTFPQFTGANTIGNSNIYQVGSKIGINETAPEFMLDVNGTAQLRGTLTLPPLATATSTTPQASNLAQWSSSAWSSTLGAAVSPTFNWYVEPIGNNTASPTGQLRLGYALGTSHNLVLSLTGTGALTSYGGYLVTPTTIATSSAAESSPLFELGASTYGSGSSSAIAQNFAWQVIPTGNDTTSPSSNLALEYSTGTSTPAVTGLSISPKGLINWATGQTFPITGTGGGTITGITTSSPLTGSGTSGSVALGLNTSALETTLNNVYPQLGAPNTFTQNQTMNLGLTVSGTASANLVNSTTGYQLNGTLFDSGDFSSGNVSLGFSNGSVAAGNANLGIGPQALESNSSGSDNVAVGDSALFLNQAGSSNTAVGLGSLSGTTGSGNTGVGYNSGTFPPILQVQQFDTFVGYGTGSEGPNTVSNSTVIGANAFVGESNALVLGGTGDNAVDVGIGTATPFNDYALDVEAVTNSVINGGVVVNAGGGNLYLGMTKGTHKFRVDTNGVAYADGGFQSSGADFAESVAVRGERSKYEPGDLLVIDSTGTRRLALARSPYSTLVAGIYSTKPGMLASPHGIDDSRPSTTEVPLAVVGIVPCKVTAQNGPIRVGDLLVTSSRPGHAMKGTSRSRMLGAVVGKALEPLPKGTGVIQVLVTLQ